MNPPSGYIQRLVGGTAAALPSHDVVGNLSAPTVDGITSITQTDILMRDIPYIDVVADGIRYNHMDREDNAVDPLTSRGTYLSHETTSSGGGDPTPVIIMGWDTGVWVIFGEYNSNITSALWNPPQAGWTGDISEIYYGQNSPLFWSYEKTFADRTPTELKAKAQGQHGVYVAVDSSGDIVEILSYPEQLTNVNDVQAMNQWLAEVAADTNEDPNILPDISNNEQTSTYPSVFKDFTPNVADITPHASAPKINEFTKKSEGGDVVILNAEDVDVSSTYSIFSSTASLMNKAIDVVDEKQVILTIPPSAEDDGVYLLSCKNSNGIGYPVVMNKAELWWVGTTRAAVGETILVYGENLTTDGGSAWLYIDDQWVESSTANPFKAEFVIPSLSNATYDIYVHNGSGGAYGWSNARSIEVWAGAQWNDDPSTWINVVDDYGFVGDDSTNNTAAFKTLEVAVEALDTWTTVYFPNGSYRVQMDEGEASITFPSNTRFVGESELAKIDLAGNRLGSEGVLYWYYRDNIVLSNMTFGINHSDDTNNTLMTFQGGKGLKLLNVNVDSKKCEKQRGNFTFKYCEDVDVQGGTWSIAANVFNQECNRMHFKGTTFQGMMEAGAIFNGGSIRTSIEKCVFQNYNREDNTSAKNFWNGRLCVQQGYAGAQFYFGENESIDAKAHETYDPFVEEQPISFSATYDDGGAQNFVNVNMNTANLREYLYGAYGGQLAITSSSDGTHVTEHWWDIENYNPTSGVIKIKVNNGVGTAGDGGVESNRCTVGIRDHAHGNSGEQILREGGTVEWKADVVSATSTTITHDGTGMTDTSDGLGDVVTVISGTGSGQSRHVLSVATNTITVSDPWNVIPDNTSVLIGGVASFQWAIYNNVFDSVEDDEDLTASAGVQFSDSFTSQIRIDSNLFRDVGDSYSFIVTIRDLDAERVASPQEWILCTNNVSENVFEHIKLSISEHVADGTDMNLIIRQGCVFRNETATGVQEYVVRMPTDIDNAYGSHSMVLQNINYTLNGGEYGDIPAKYKNTVEA